MPSKSEVYVVTKHHEEKGVTLQTQYVIEARSRKEALEQVLEEEGINIEKQGYDVEKPVRTRSKATGKRGNTSKDSVSPSGADRAPENGARTDDAGA